MTQQTIEAAEAQLIQNRMNKIDKLERNYRIMGKVPFGMFLISIPLVVTKFWFEKFYVNAGELSVIFAMIFLLANNSIRRMDILKELMELKNENS